MKKILSFLAAGALSLSAFGAVPVIAAQSITRDLGDRLVSIDNYEIDLDDFFDNPRCPEGMETLGLTVRYNVPSRYGQPGKGTGIAPPEYIDDFFYSYNAVINIDVNDDTCKIIENMDLSEEDLYVGDTSMKKLLTILQIAKDIKAERYEWRENGDIYRHDVRFALPAYFVTEDSAPVDGKTYYEWYEEWHYEEYLIEAENPDFTDSNNEYYELVMIAPNYSNDIDPSKDYYFIDGFSPYYINVTEVKNPSAGISLFLGLETQEEEIIKTSYIGRTSIDMDMFPLTPFSEKEIYYAGWHPDMSEIELWPEDLNHVATINGETYLFFYHQPYYWTPLFADIYDIDALSIVYTLDGELVEASTAEDEITYSMLPFMENGFLAGVISIEEIDVPYYDNYYGEWRTITEEHAKTTMKLLDSNLNSVYQWDDAVLQSGISGVSEKHNYSMYSYLSNVDSFLGYKPLGLGDDDSDQTKLNVLKINLLGGNGDNDNVDVPNTFDGLHVHLVLGTAGLIGMGLVASASRRMNKA